MNMLAAIAKALGEAVGISQGEWGFGALGVANSGGGRTVGFV